MKTKICSNCGRELPLSEFCKSNDEKGLSSKCKECNKRYQKYQQEKLRLSRKKELKKWIDWVTKSKERFEKFKENSLFKEASINLGGCKKKIKKK